MPSEFGELVAREENTPDFWKIKHPTLDHLVVTYHTDPQQALQVALGEFQSWAKMFKGKFLPQP